jgi:hypothetical protein
MRILTNSTSPEINVHVSFQSFREDSNSWLLEKYQVILVIYSVVNQLVMCNIDFIYVKYIYY